VENAPRRLETPFKATATTRERGVVALQPAKKIQNPLIGEEMTSIGVQHTSGHSGTSAPQEKKPA